MEKNKVFHVLPFGQMRNYISTGRDGEQTLFEQDLQFFLLKNFEKEMRTAVIFSFAGESDYRKLTYDEVKMLEKDKKTLEKEGIGAFSYKLRKPEELMMVSHEVVFTRSINKLKDTRYLGRINPLHPHRFHRERKIPSEYTISDRRQRSFQFRSNSKTSNETNTITNKQYEMQNRLFYYSTFKKSIERVLGSVFEKVPDFFASDRPCTVVNQIDRDQALMYYSVNFCDSYEDIFKKEVVSQMIYSSIDNQENAPARGGAMDVPTTWEQGGWITRELAQDGFFFAYMMMFGSEMNKPYRSFPNVHFDENDMDQWMMINLKYDNNAKRDVPITLRAFGGSFFKNYDFDNNSYVTNAMIDLQKDLLPQQRRIIYRKHQLYCAQQYQNAEKSPKTKYPRMVNPLESGQQVYMNKATIPSNGVSMMSRHTSHLDIRNRFTADYIANIYRGKRTLELTVTMHEFIRQIHHLLYYVKMRDLENKPLEPLVNSYWGFRDSELEHILKVISKISGIWNEAFLDSYSLWFRRVDEEMPILDGFTQNHTSILYITLNDNKVKQTMNDLINNQGMGVRDAEKTVQYRPVQNVFKITNNEALQTRAQAEHFEKRLVDYIGNPEILFIMPTSAYPCMTCDDFVSHTYQPSEIRQIYAPKLSNLVAGTKKVPQEEEDQFKMAIFSRDQEVESEWAYWKNKRGFYSDSLQQRQLQEAKRDEGVDYDIFYQENQMTDIYNQVSLSAADGSGLEFNDTGDFSDFDKSFDQSQLEDGVDSGLKDDYDDIEDLIKLYGDEKYDMDSGYDRDLKLFTGGNEDKEKAILAEKEKKAKTSGYGMRDEGMRDEMEPFDYSLDENSIRARKEEEFDDENLLSREEMMAKSFENRMHEAAVNVNQGKPNICADHEDPFGLDFGDDQGKDDEWSETGNNPSFGDSLGDDEDLFGGQDSYDDLFSKTEVAESIEKEFGSILGKKEGNEFIDVSELSGFKDDGFGVSDEHMGDGVDFNMDFKMEEDFNIEDNFGHGGMNDEMSAKTTHKSEKIGRIKITDLENFKW
jgi:hypothetical protein